MVVQDFAPAMGHPVWPGGGYPLGEGSCTLSSRGFARTRGCRNSFHNKRKKKKGAGSTAALGFIYVWFFILHVLALQAPKSQKYQSGSGSSEVLGGLWGCTVVLRCLRGPEWPLARAWLNTRRQMRFCSFDCFTVFCGVFGVFFIKVVCFQKNIKLCILHRGCCCQKPYRFIDYVNNPE